MSELLVALIACAAAALILIFLGRPRRDAQEMQGEHRPLWPWWHPDHPDDEESTWCQCGYPGTPKDCSNARMALP
jgi:hypothetical protein